MVPNRARSVLQVSVRSGCVNHSTTRPRDEREGTNRLISPTSSPHAKLHSSSPKDCYRVLEDNHKTFSPSSLSTPSSPLIVSSVIMSFPKACNLARRSVVPHHGLRAVPALLTPQTEIILDLNNEPDKPRRSAEHKTSCAHCIFLMIRCVILSAP